MQYYTCLFLQILVAALKFFLGHEKAEDGDSDSDDEVRLIESNSGKNTRTGNLNYTRVRFQSLKAKLAKFLMIEILPEGG